MLITSGGVKGNAALVNEDGELLTSAAQKTQLYVAGEKGNAFYVVTNFLTITTANTEYGILYIKNTSEYNLHFSQVRTCGSADQYWRWVKNPTLGTLISGGVASIPENLEFNSGKTFQGTVKVGGQGFTVTDGKHLTQWINGGFMHAESQIESAVTLELNNSAALVAKVATVSSVVCASILCFFD